MEKSQLYRIVYTEVVLLYDVNTEENPFEYFGIKKQ